MRTTRILLEQIERLYRAGERPADLDVLEQTAYDGPRVAPVTRAPVDAWLLDGVLDPRD